MRSGKWWIFPLILLAVYAAHIPLLHLPYYWDEAGYYIPAAYDFFRTGALIPYSTLANAHPPLPSVYLALWWKLFGFAPVVTRTAMCFVAAVALAAVYRLALITTRKHTVAIATVLLTAIYPVWFAQSSLAHADLFAAAATLWGLVFLFEQRWWAVVCFSLAALAKETAIVTPVALAGWEFWLALRRFFSNSDDVSTRGSSSAKKFSALSHFRVTAKLLIPIVPLAAWYGYFWHRTGFLFGNPEYLRYNATATLTPLRVLLAFLHRVLHITAHMNMFVPVLATLACMLLPPVEESPGRLRERISFPDQARFYVAIVANLIFFSVLGGALLTRYLLPLYPLILLLCVNTFRRRLRPWPGLVALSAAGFLAGLFVNPLYRFAPEDNLAYSDFIRLQQDAIQQIVSRYPYATVLTAWPASDELSKPELGYVRTPVRVAAVDNFSLPQIRRASQLAESFTVGLIFSTKYDTPHLWLSLGGRNRSFDTRFFDFHRDLPPETIARLLGGTVVWQEDRKGLWAAVLHFDRPLDARAFDHSARHGP